jgi:hypothetical protein
MAQSITHGMTVMRTLTKQEIHAVSGSSSGSLSTSGVTGPFLFIAAVLINLFTGKVPSWFQNGF